MGKGGFSGQLKKLQRNMGILCGENFVPAISIH